MRGRGGEGFRGRLGAELTCESQLSATARERRENWAAG
jgi:hypothetical protein